MARVATGCGRCRPGFKAMASGLENRNCRQKRGVGVVLALDIGGSRRWRGPAVWLGGCRWPTALSV